MEPIRAFRIWQLEGDSLFSVSVNVWDSWTPVMRAKCCGGWIESSYCKNPPVRDCGCGIYSLKLPYIEDPAKMLEEFVSSMAWKNFTSNPFALLNALSSGNDIFFGRPRFTPVMGYVDIWGKIIEHEWGYRSEYAQVQSIFLPVENFADPDKIRRKISSRYGCETYIYCFAHASKRAKELADIIDSWIRIRGKEEHGQ